MSALYNYFREVSEQLYDFMLQSEAEFGAPEASKLIKSLLLDWLDDLEIDLVILKSFKRKITRRTKDLLKLNQEIKRELTQHLPTKYCQKGLITDLNSIVMGVPNDSDSDLDFTIAVKTAAEQKQVRKVLEQLGYKLTHKYSENIPSRLKWHSYHKWVRSEMILSETEELIEIEVKVRPEKAVDHVMVAHRGIRDDLTPPQKLKVSFIKSVLSDGDKKTYKTFKYLLYTAMFDGSLKTFVFKHDP